MGSGKVRGLPVGDDIPRLFEKGGRCYSTSGSSGSSGSSESSGDIFLSFNKIKDIVPENHVEMFDNLTPEQKYIMKSKYKNKAVIYLWLNKLNGKCYIGSTVNLSSRLANYFDSYYLNNNKDKMAICAALLQYGYTNFNLYVLETFTELITRHQLLIREDYFVSLVKPSYNIAAILNTFVGENHPRFGKSVSQEVKDKISKTLTGRKLSQEAIENHRKGAAAYKKPVYCYNFFTKEFVADFESIRSMARSLDMGHISIQRKIGNNKPFNCVYKGVPQTWVLYLKPITSL